MEIFVTFPFFRFVDVFSNPFILVEFEMTNSISLFYKFGGLLSFQNIKFMLSRFRASHTLDICKIFIFISSVQ